MQVGIAMSISLDGARKYQEYPTERGCLASVTAGYETGHWMTQSVLALRKVVNSSDLRWVVDGFEP